MKSLVKLIINLGIKLALIALLYAIAMGLSSCDENAVSNSSFSTANNQEIIESEESLVANPSDTSVPSISLQASETNPENNIENKSTDNTRNEEVANPTEQTRQDTSNTNSVSNNQEENNSDSAPTPTPKASGVSGQSATPTPVPTATPQPTSTPKPTTTPIPTPTNTPVPTATPTPEPTEAPEPTPQPAVAARIRVTLRVWGSDDPEGEDNDVSVIVYRTYTVQPKDGCTYHSYNTGSYVAPDKQIDRSDINTEFYAQYPNGLAIGYAYIGDEIVGFVDD